MDGLMRRRATEEEIQEETIEVSWADFNAQTRYRTRETINTAGRNLYITIPFQEDYTGFQSGVTVNSAPYGIMGACYSDEGCTELVGYYYNNKMNASFTTTGVPRHKFNTRVLVAPSGYYVRPVVIKNGYVFTSNATARTYAHNYVNEVVLK